MVIDYTIVLLVIGLLYALVKQFLPDFPLSDVAFQAVVMYLLAKLGVIIIGAPVANAIRKMFGKPEIKSDFWK